MTKSEYYLNKLKDNTTQDTEELFKTEWAGMHFMSKRFALKYYLGLTDEELFKAEYECTFFPSDEA
jgi:hypothetical protein